MVILIQLRDPVVQDAKYIADLIPSPNATTAKQIAAKILAKNCRDVVFILDRWDELPSNFCKGSIFYQLIQPELSKKNPLHESEFIATSRPIASGDLHPVVSSQVEVFGFTHKELNEYFTECLGDDTKAVETL